MKSHVLKLLHHDKDCPLKERLTFELKPITVLQTVNSCPVQPSNSHCWTSWCRVILDGDWIIGAPPDVNGVDGDGVIPELVAHWDGVDPDILETNETSLKHWNGDENKNDANFLASCFFSSFGVLS